MKMGRPVSRYRRIAQIATTPKKATRDHAGIPTVKAYMAGKHHPGCQQRTNSPR
jgi:hypothetical protein